MGVDWDKVGKVKEGIIARFKMLHNDREQMKVVMTHAHEIFKDAGMPEDRIDYILEKWAKYAASEGNNGCVDKGEYGYWCPKGDQWYCKKNCKEEKMDVDTKDCYFDPGCHKLVDWDKIGKAKEGIIARFKMMHNDKEKMQGLMTRVHELFKHAGMPEDRIDYILEKWAKYAASEDNDGCVDKGKYGVWCPKGEKWYCLKNCEDNKPDADGCYDKGEHGVWCPKGDGWYCKENCKDQKKGLDASGCYNKG